MKRELSIGIIHHRVPTLRNPLWLPAALAGALLLGNLHAAAPAASHFGMFKGTDHEQTSAAPPPAAPKDFSYHLFVNQSSEDSLAGAFLTPPGSVIPMVLSPGDAPLELIDQGIATSQADLDKQVPNGTYNFTLIDAVGNLITGGLPITGDAYPGIPAMQNFAASQDVDTTKPFTVQWTSSGLSASDYIVVDVSQDGSQILSSPAPWQPSPLSGTATSYVIPANSFDPAGDAPLLNITFIKITERNTTSIPGVIGLAGYYRSTEIALKLKSAGGGGGGDTTPPTLSSSNPANGALNVPATSTVQFFFSEPMAAGISISWSPNVNAASFQYGWSADKRSLTCTYPPGFPASSSITWILNPPGQLERFKDLAGNPLSESKYGGVFITSAGGGGGGGGGCEGNLRDRKGVFSLGKLEDFNQTAAATITPATDPAASFFSSIQPETGTTITAASLKAPDGTSMPLQSALGTYFLANEFTSHQQLDTAIPAGNYQASVQFSAGGAGALTLNLGASYPPIPGAVNFDAAQAVNAGADFILQFTPFTGAGPNDLIQFEVRDENGNMVFSTPDACANPPRTLAVSATSVTIPKGTLADNKTYTASLAFYKVTDSKTSASPAFSAIAMLARTTTFPIKTGTGGSGGKPVITAFRIAADGRFEADVTGSPTRTLTLKASPDYLGWTPVATGIVPAGGSLTLKDPRTPLARFQAYRVESK